jgi:hypothetical protein
VSVANARAGTSSLEMNGLGNIISGTATLGGISASNRWLSYVDSTTTDLTLDSLLAVQEQIQQFGGNVKPGAKVMMGYRRAAASTTCSRTRSGSRTTRRSAWVTRRRSRGTA